MSIFRFSTNINCRNCLRAVTPFLDGEARITRWEVDILDPGKILTIEGAGLIDREVIALLSKAGYTAHRLD